MKRKQVKRLHSDDARMLRALLLDVVASLHELENAVGYLQSNAVIAGDVMAQDNADQVEVLEA